MNLDQIKLDNQNIPGPTKFSGKFLAQFIAYGTLLGLGLPYYVSLSLGKIEPFPNVSLTEAILNYPSFAIFRYIEIPCGILLFLVYSMQLWWIESKAELLKVEINNQGSLIASYVLSLVFLLIGMASIDMEEMNYDIYAYCFAFAYGFTLNAFILFNRNIIKLRDAQESSINPVSYYLKMTVVLVLILLTIYAFIQGYVWDFFNQTGGNDFNAFGYVYTLVFCLYYASFIYDFENYDLIFYLDPSVPVSQINNNNRLQQQQQTQQQPYFVSLAPRYQEIEL